MSEEPAISGYVITQTGLLELQGAVMWLVGHWSATRQEGDELPRAVDENLVRLENWIDWTKDSKALLGDWPPLPKDPA